MKDKTPLYPYPASYAHEHGKLEQYRASYKANIACKGAIETAIADNYRDNRLGPEAVQQVLKQFDYERIFYVLANTVREKDWDGRISHDNKIWAKTIPVYENIDGFGDNRNVYFVVNSHPGLMDLFSDAGPARLRKKTGEKALCPQKHEAERGADGNRT